MGIATAHNGIVDKQQGVVGCHPHRVEQGLRALGVVRRPGVAIFHARAIRGAGVAQADACLVSRRDALHPLAGGIHRQLVKTGIGAGDDHESVVLRGIPQVTVAATCDTGIRTCVVGRRQDIVAIYRGAIRIHAGAHHIVARRRVVAARRVDTGSHASAPEIVVVASGKRRRVAEARTCLLVILCHRDGRQGHRHQKQEIPLFHDMHYYSYTQH